MSRGRPRSPEVRQRVLQLLAEIGDTEVVAQRVGLSRRAVATIARQAARTNDPERPGTPRSST